MTSTQLSQLRDMLPRGSRGKIKEATAFSYSYIDQVLTGKRHSHLIITIALEILDEMLLAEKLNSVRFQQIARLLKRLR